MRWKQKEGGHALQPRTGESRQRPWKMTITLVACLCASTGAAATDTLWHEKTKTDPTIVALPSLAPVVKQVEDAVLTIQVEANVRNARGDRGGVPPLFRGFGFEFRLPEPPPSKGQGSGFIIHEAGYALTNYHVIENADRIQAKVGNGQELYDAEVIGIDPKTDVALIQLTGGGKQWPYIPLGDSDALQIGDFVVAIGNPFGLSQTVSSGIVSANHRRDIAPSGRQGLYDFIQTDASINPGNSGGPLLNLNGEAVGINAAVNTAGQGLGFAIPINLVKKLIPQLKEKGSVARSWIGIGLQPVTPELAPGLGLKRARGALVAQVIENSPAERAGLKPGDVIIAFNGVEVKHSSDLPLLAAHVGVGKKVRVEIVRDNRRKSMFIVLGELPEDKRASYTPPRTKSEAIAIDGLGIHAGNLNRELRERLSLGRRVQGVHVQRVMPNSAAQKGGLIPNDIIMKVNDRAVKDAQALKRTIQKTKKGGLIRLLVKRGSSTVFIAVVKPK